VAATRIGRALETSGREGNRRLDLPSARDARHANARCLSGARPVPPGAGDAGARGLNSTQRQQKLNDAPESPAAPLTEVGMDAGEEEMDGADAGGSARDDGRGCWASTSGASTPACGDNFAVARGGQTCKGAALRPVRSTCS
jgi:hypothetical protein